MTRLAGLRCGIEAHTFGITIDAHRLRHIAKISKASYWTSPLQANCSDERPVCNRATTVVVAVQLTLEETAIREVFEDPHAITEEGRVDEGLASQLAFSSVLFLRYPRGREESVRIQPSYQSDTGTGQSGTCGGAKPSTEGLSPRFFRLSTKGWAEAN
ncbi:hypothetical protein GFH48_00115 [Streptomyces fagopyri]|uniref:Uncharacterized protein n=1 Tax=Streptomyces fagopyri TaxID=2662397 RepID=A0A5Q0L4Z1_9ACTN|nr:hypothetical protein [Streptomyces fagopyri]QFZ71894.1 hypothetical protein GFH48_00115 [Streptomyces fagopyri]